MRICDLIYASIGCEWLTTDLAVDTQTALHSLHTPCCNNEARVLDYHLSCARAYHHIGNPNQSASCFTAAASSFLYISQVHQLAQAPSTVSNAQKHVSGYTHIRQSNLQGCIYHRYCPRKYAAIHRLAKALAAKLESCSCKNHKTRSEGYAQAAEETICTPSVPSIQWD